MKRINKKGILLSLLGIILSRVFLFEMNPIAIAYFGALYLEQNSRFLLFCSVVLGISLSMSLLDAVKYGLVLLVISVVVLLIENKKKKLSAIRMGLLAGVVTIGLSITRGAVLMDSIDYYLLMLLEGVLIFSCTILFSCGVKYLLYSKRGQVPTNEQLLSLVLFGTLFLLGIPEIAGFPFSIMESSIFFLVLLIGYKYGCGAGAMIGTLSGLVVHLQGSILDLQKWKLHTALTVGKELDFELAAVLCIMGILAGMIRKLGRLATSFIYIVTYLFLGYYFYPSFMEVKQLCALSSALILFLFLPKYISDKNEIRGETTPKEYEMKQYVQLITRKKLKEFSESFRKLSHTLKELSEEKMSFERDDINRIFDDLSERLCKDCPNSSVCWKQEFYDTYKGAFSILSSAKKNGEILKQDIPEDFAKKCIHLNEFLTEMNREFELANLNMSWHNRMAESREAIAGQLGEVAHIIDGFSTDLYSFVEIEDALEDRLLRKLRLNGMKGKEFSVIEKRNRKREVHLCLKTEKGRCITTKEAATLTGNILGKKMRPAEGSKNVISKQYERYVFVEDTNYKILTGLARAPKAGEKVSGDNFSKLELSTGELILSLSDGMGSGITACEESGSVIDLLEQLLEAGFAEESAIKLINSILVVKSEEKSFSTLDMSIVNLYTGICEFLKIGAATTFIKRDHMIESITSESLPVGVFNRVDFDKTIVKLYDGDFIIMITDGIIDCLVAEEKEEFLKSVILEKKTNNPQELANYILERAMEQNNYTAIDDMTIMVAGIWKK